MRVIALLSSLGLIVSVGQTAEAQSRALFAGTWKLNDAPPRQQLEPGKVGGSGRGVPQLRITQTRDNLVIANKRFATTYALDGSETKSTIKVRGKEFTMKNRAKWEGDQLILTGRAEVEGDVYVERQVLSLDPRGALILDVTHTNMSTSQEIRVKLSYGKQPEGITVRPLHDPMELRLAYARTVRAGSPRATRAIT